jgi:parallel beta-helix repeat protein
MRPKLLILILFGLCGLSANATTYYVANAGSDSNNGTSMSVPWRTIAHVNAQIFGGGDSILFHRGDIWREQLVPPSSGSSGSVITFGVYGSGNLPIISGADLVNAFSVYSGSVYVASVAWSPRELLLDDTVIGRVVGSRVALTSNNEWFYSSGSLYLYSTSNPNSRKVEAQRRFYGVRITGVNYVTISGIAESLAVTGLDVHNADHITMCDGSANYNTSAGYYPADGGATNVLLCRFTAHDNGAVSADDNAVGIGGLGNASSNITVDSGNLYGSFHENIEIAPTDTGASVTGVVISNNIIHDGRAGGIRVSGKGHSVTIQSNLIYSNSGHGIVEIAGTSGSGTTTLLVYNNTIHGNARNGFYLDGSTITLRNNIFSQNGTAVGWHEISTTPATTLTSDYNDWYHSARGNFMLWNRTDGTFAQWKTNSSQDAHSISADPRFTSAGSDFTLLSSSPAINAGSNLGSAYQNDLLPGSVWPGNVLTGNQNSFGAGWEMGAYIYTGRVGIMVSPGVKFSAPTGMQ